MEFNVRVTHEELATIKTALFFELARMESDDIKELLLNALTAVNSAEVIR